MSTFVGARGGEEGARGQKSTLLHALEIVGSEALRGVVVYIQSGAAGLIFELNTLRKAKLGLMRLVLTAAMHDEWPFFFRVRIF